jgi:DNA-3-methyladenine glycosylase
VRRGDSPVAELARDWFARPTVEVARDLVGCSLLVDTGTASAVVARIVETEAYLGTSDPASHAFRGPTPRSKVMFGPAAVLYVYFTYGMHYCANIVTEADGVAGAVLLRAAAVEAGEATVIARRRDGLPPAALLRGPGNLCRGLGITLTDNGIELLEPASRIHLAAGTSAPPIAVSTRIGLRQAADRLLRFNWLGDPAVSRPAPRTERGDGP